MTLYKLVKNIFKTSYMVILILIFANGWLNAQNKSPFFKFGVEAGVGIFEPDDINQLIDTWLHEQFEIVEIQGDTKVRPEINLSGYLSFALIKYLELRIEMEYLYALTLFDSFDSDDLNITITNYNPGISVNLKFDILQFGGGIFKYFSKIKWEDNVFNFTDTWKGDNYGYHINVGLNRQLSSHIGFSSIVFYRKIIIEELTNENNQVLHLIPEKRNFNLDLSGFVLRLGLYYTF